MQSPPFPRYLVPPRSKYSPQHNVLKHPQLPFLPQCQRPSFTPILEDQTFCKINLNQAVGIHNSNSNHKLYKPHWHKPFEPQTVQAALTQTIPSQLHFFPCWLQECVTKFSGISPQRNTSLHLLSVTDVPLKAVPDQVYTTCPVFLHTTGSTAGIYCFGIAYRRG